MSQQTSIPEQADRWFDIVRGYLNTASVGLPTRQTMEITRRRLDEWQAGGCQPPSFDADVRRSRQAYARISGTQASLVGIVGQASVVGGMVAASLDEGSVVLCAEEEFTSVTFPFLADPRLDVRFVPLAALPDTADSSIDLVAVSAAQSSDGRTIDLDRLTELSQRHRFRTFVDATQAAGWMDLGSDRFDVTVCHGYKWLCSPRGAGFLTVSEDALQWLQPVNAGWYAGEDPWDAIYGPPLRLASDARRFDVSPVWFAYAGAVPSLELIADLGPEAIGAHSIGLANRFREALGLEASDSAIVSVETERGSVLAEAGFVVANRAGKVRLSFYLYNTDEDADRAAEIITR